MTIGSGDDQHEGQVREPEPQARFPGPVGHHEEDRAGEHEEHDGHAVGPRSDEVGPQLPAGDPQRPRSGVFTASTPGDGGEERRFEVVAGRGQEAQLPAPADDHGGDRLGDGRGRVHRARRHPPPPTPPERASRAARTSAAGAPATSTRSRLAVAAAPAGRSRTMRPWSITTTRSQTVWASASRWVEKTIDAFFFRSPSRVRSADHLAGVEPFRRFVQQEDVGPVHDGPGQRHPLPLPLGEAADDPVGELVGAGPLQRVGRRRLPLAAGHARQAGQVGDVLEGDVVAVERRILGQVPDPGPGRRHRRPDRRRRGRRCPADPGNRPASRRSNVVLPAPLGPRRPRISPGRRSRSTSSTAVRGPYRMTIPLACNMRGGHLRDRAASSRASRSSGRSPSSQASKPIGRSPTHPELRAGGP